MGYCQIDSATQTSAHQALKLDHTRWWACLIDRWRTAGRYESRIGITTANIVNQQTKALSAKQQRQLKSEKARGKVLLAAKAKKTSELKALRKQETSLESEVSSQVAASSEAEASSSRAASEAASKEASASQVAASEQAAAASSQAVAAAQAAKQAEEAQKSAAKEQAAQTQQATTNEGDMNTAEQGTIIGNSRSKIYHVPGQAGYHMNSANAVYFNSEADAQAAGYRKALR